MRPAAAGAALALSVAIVSSCGVRSEDDAHLVDDDKVPFDLLDVGTTEPPDATAPSGATSSIEVCFVDDDRVVAAVRPAEPGIDLAAVVEMLTEGPNQLEEAAGLVTALPDEALAAGVETSGGIAEVDLTGAFADTAGRHQVLAITQVVCTLTGRPGVGQVTFTLDGQPVAVPRGDGSTTTDPVTRDDYRQITSNAADDDVSGQ